MNQAGAGGWTSPARKPHLSQPSSLYPDDGKEHRDDVTFIRSKKRANPPGIVGEHVCVGGSKSAKTNFCIRHVSQR